MSVRKHPGTVPFRKIAIVYTLSRAVQEVSESKALLSAALDGFGIVFGPEDFLEPALRSGELVRLLADYEAPSRQMHLLYTANRQRTAKLRRFIDAALARFGAP